MNKNYEIAKNVLELVGGKENVAGVFYCATRLRFNLKDVSRADTDALKKTSGVVGVMNAGGMYQVVIGQNVEKVYDQLCAIGGFKKEAAIDEILDEDMVDNKLTLRKVGQNIIGYLVASMTPLINILIGAALWNTVASILVLIGVITNDSPVYMTCYIIYRSLFYFLPIYLGYTAAKALKITNPVWGMVIGGLSIVPDFIALAGSMETLKIFGLVPAPISDYGASVLPVLLGVFVFKYLYDFLKKIIPDLVFSIAAPFIAFAVMVILMLSVFCPLGTYIGNGISVVFTYMSNAILPVKIVAYILLTVLWPIITLCGMHLPIYFAAVALITQTGSDPFSLACMLASVFMLNGMSLGAIVKFKNADNKNMAISAAISACIGGICEPVLYGIALRNKSATKTMIICGAVAGLLAAILQPVCYTIVAGNSIFVLVTPWTGGSSTNIILGSILGIASMIIGALGVIFLAKLEEE